MKMGREEAVALVQRIVDSDRAGDDEVDGWLDQLDRALGCPTGCVSGLIFRPKGPKFAWRSPPAAIHPASGLSRTPTAARS